MSTPKFHVGQQVVCIDAEVSDLDYLRCYVVTGVEDCLEGIEYYVDNGRHCWMEERFEDYDTWASFQKPVDAATELALAKLQIVSLQANKAAMLAQIASLKFSRREQETLASDYVNTAKGLRELLAQAAKREDVLINALQCIVADYSRGGYGHFQAKIVAEGALKELGL